MPPESYVVTQDITQASLWQKGKPLLGRLDMELTERCNNNCIHCCINRPANDPAAREKELSTDDIKAILKEAASLECLTVRFTGGEPLLRDDFEELYTFTRKLGIKVLLFTNGRGITPYLAELFARIPPLEKIEITLYGMEKASYEAVAQSPASFETAQRGIALLLEKKVPFVVKSALLPPNKAEMEAFETWAATIPWMDKPPSYSMFFDFRCRRDSADKNRRIKALRLSPKKGLAVLTRDRELYIEGMKQFCTKFTRPAGDALFSCGAGEGGGCVDAYGNLQLCMMLRHPDTVVDLKKSSLKDALTRFFPEVRSKKALSRDYLARCANCFLKGLCEQCPAKSWMEHGTLDTPVDYFCEIAHVQAEFLGLLKAGEKAWQVEDWQERIAEFANAEYTIKKQEQYDGSTS